MQQEQIPEQELRFLTRLRVAHAGVMSYRIREHFGERGLMNFREFQTRVREIKKETFEGTADNPLDRGIERARFNEQKLEQLVQVARDVPFATAKRRYDAWMRQLQRTREARMRMERMKEGIYPTTSRVPAEQAAVAVK